MSKTQKFSRYRLWCSGHGRQQIQGTSQVYWFISVCFQYGDIKTEKKGIGSCSSEKKERIQIIETYEIIVNCTRINMIVLGLVSILRFLFPYVVRCAIWYRLYNLKNVRKTRRGVLKLYAETISSSFLKLNFQKYKHTKRTDVLLLKPAGYF